MKHLKMCLGQRWFWEGREKRSRRDAEEFGGWDDGTQRAVFVLRGSATAGGKQQHGGSGFRTVQEGVQRAFGEAAAHGV